MSVDDKKVRERLAMYMGQPLDDYSCPICSSWTWIVQDSLVASPGYDPSSNAATGDNYHGVLVSCSHCGNTMRFDATRLGVV